MAHLVFIVVLCDEIGEGPQSEFLQAGCGDEEDAAVVGLCIPWVRSLPTRHHASSCTPASRNEATSTSKVEMLGTHVDVNPPRK